MKTSLIILFFALFFCSCTKEKFPKQILGRWELREGYTIGINGGVYPPGNGNILEFTLHTYKQYYDGQFYVGGSYTIEKDTLMPSGDILDRLIMENYHGRPFIQQIEKNKMTLRLPGTEHTILHFERIN